MNCFLKTKYRRMGFMPLRRFMFSALLETNTLTIRPAPICLATEYDLILTTLSLLSPLLGCEKHSVFHFSSAVCMCINQQ
jgi:hypothetical protein